MAKFLIILASMVGLIAAGVLDTRWLPEGRIEHTRPMMRTMDDGRTVLDPIVHMTGTELMRQKLLLQVLDHVHEPLRDTELRNVPDTFVMDETRYRGGLDPDMLHLIELCQNGRMLTKHERYTISNNEHVRQMIGLKHLLVRSIDWETFVQNVCCARNRINGVLFVNALLLTVRERDDMRRLIVPGLHEILPELYIDRDILRTARNMDINLLTTTTDHDTRRPNLLDMIGLGGRVRLTKDQNVGWGGLGLGRLVTSNRNQYDMEDRIILGGDRRDVTDMNLKLVTEDVGLKSFLHYMINDLCLKENELERREGRNMDLLDERERWNTRTMNTGMHETDDTIRRDLWLDTNTHRMDTMMGTDMDLIRRMGSTCMKCITERTVWDCHKCLSMTKTEMINNLSDACINCIHRQTEKDCVMCETGKYTGDSMTDMHSRWGTHDKDNTRWGMHDDNNRWGMHDERNDDIGRWNTRTINNDWRMHDTQGGSWRNTRMDMMDMMQDLPTTSINDDRLLHVNRKKLRSMTDMNRWNRNMMNENTNMRDRFLNVIHRHDIDDGRKTKWTNDMNTMDRMSYGIGMGDRLTDIDVLRGMHDICKRCINNMNTMDCNQCVMMSTTRDLNRLSEDCIVCVHNQIDTNCRRCQDRIDNTMMNRDTMMGINNRRREMMTAEVGLHQLNMDCMRCVEQRNVKDCNTCRMTTDQETLNRLNRDCMSCITHMTDMDCDRCMMTVRQNGGGMNRWNMRDMHGDNMWRDNNMRDNDFNDLPTTSINNERLLHVNRKRLQTMNNMNMVDDGRNMRERFMNVIHRNTIDDGRKTKWTNDMNTMDRMSYGMGMGDRLTDIDVLRGMHDLCKRCINNMNTMDCNQCVMMTTTRDLNRLSEDCIVCIHNQIDKNCRRCQNRIDNTMTNRDTMMGTNNRRRDMMTEEVGLHQLNMDCMRCVEQRNVRDCNTCRMTTDQETLNRLNRDCMSCITHMTDMDCDRCMMTVRQNGGGMNRWNMRDMHGDNMWRDTDMRDTQRGMWRENDMRDIRGDTMWRDNNMRNNDFNDLPTTSINNDRLIHVNRKRLQTMNNMNMVDDGRNMRERFMNVMHRNTIDDGRKTNMRNDFGMGTMDRNMNMHDRDMLTDMDLLRRMDQICTKCITERNVWDCNRCLSIERNDDLNRLSEVCLTCIHRQTDTDCQRCLHNVRDGTTETDGIRRSVHDGRMTMRSTGIHGLNDDCLRCIDQKTVTDCKRCSMTLNQMDLHSLNGKCIACIYRQNEMDCNNCRNMLHTDDLIRTRDNFRTDDVNVRLNDNCQNCIRTMNDRDCDNCLMTTSNIELDRLHGSCLECIQRRTHTACQTCRMRLEREPEMRVENDRLRYMNMIRNDDNERRRLDNDYMDDDVIRRKHNIVDGRRVMLNTEDREETIRSDLLLHNIRQIMARMNLERISLGLENLRTTNEQRIDNINIRSLNERTGVTNRDVTHLNDIIETTLRRTQNTNERMRDIEMDREIARTLMGRNGEISIIQMISQILIRNGGDSLQTLRDIGVDLNDIEISKVMHELIQTIDNIRTQHLGTYRREDLMLDGVRINNVHVDRLMTRLEDRNIDLRNLVEDNTNKVIVTRQKQLTHKDFKIDIDVDSDRSRRVVMRILLGPKRTVEMGREMTLNERRTSFMLLDTRVVDLKAGNNIIQHKSHDIRWTARDTTPLTKIYERIMLAERGGTTWMHDTIIGQDCRFPHHLILPRGRIDGLDMELLVIMTPLEHELNTGDERMLRCGMGISMQGLDHHSMGFPLDRHIEDTRDLETLTNMHSVDVKIYHEDRVNTNRW